MRVSKEANLHESTVRGAAEPEPEVEPKRPRRESPAKLAALRLAGGDRSRIQRRPDGSYIVKQKGYAD